MASNGDSSLAAEVLSELCRDYYEPIVAFIRYSERDAESARDLAHAFFAHVLEGHAFGGADRNQGRFRSYLLGAVKQFLTFGGSLPFFNRANLRIYWLVFAADFKFSISSVHS